jgi:hypothetical protein
MALTPAQLTAQAGALLATLDDYNAGIVQLTRVMARRLDAIPGSPERSRAVLAFNELTALFDVVGPQLRAAYNATLAQGGVAPADGLARSRATIEQRVKLNSFAAGKPVADGVLEIWIGWQKVHEQRNVVLVTDPKLTAADYLAVQLATDAKVVVATVAA